MEGSEYRHFYPGIAGGVSDGKTQCTVTEKPPTVTPGPDDGRQSVASGKGGKGGKKGGKSKKVPTPVPVTPPEPLRMEHKVVRVKWNNTQDCKVWSQAASSDLPTTTNQTITTAPL